MSTCSSAAADQSILAEVKVVFSKAPAVCSGSPEDRVFSSVKSL